MFNKFASAQGINTLKDSKKEHLSWSLFFFRHIAPYTF